ncbi:Laccase-2 [Metarhizium anisopliae]
MDGVVGVTQCSISSGQSYTYKFEIHKEQHGTFWYHAHSAVKRADGLYGGLVVHKPADSRAVQSDASLYGYESEKMLLIGDWYHLPADRVLAEYKDFRNFAYEPVPDSLLINGAGSYNCSNARPGKPVDCVETDAPEVEVPGNKAVRLRIVNTGASAGYSLQLEGASFQLITVDGGTAVSRSTPQSSTLGVLYPGERMDVLLLSDEASLNRNKPRNSTMKIILDLELMQLMNPALTRMQSFSLSWIPSAETEHQREGNPPKVEIYNIQNAEGLLIPEDAPLRKNPVEIALLYTSLSINSFKNDEPWGELNHTSWTWKDPQAKPLLAIDRTEWENGTEQANPLRRFRVPRYEAGEDRWLDLVVNNVDDKGHPFHLVNIPPSIHEDTY